MTSINKLAQRPHSIGLAPTAVQGVRITSPLTLTSSFIANNEFFGSVATADLMMETAEQVINNIQTMYVDPSLTPVSFRITFPETQQTIFVQGKTQGYYPIAIGQQGQIEAQALPIPSGADPYSIMLQFLNVPVDQSIWSTTNLGLQKGLSSSASTLIGNVQLQPVTLANVVPSGMTAGQFNVLIDGFDVTGNGATTATDIQVTLGVIESGLGGSATLSYDLFIPVIGTDTSLLSIRFPQPLCTPNSSNNASLIVPAMGAGNTFAEANIYYRVV